MARHQICEQVRARKTNTGVFASGSRMREGGGRGLRTLAASSSDLKPEVPGRKCIGQRIRALAAGRRSTYHVDGPGGVPTLDVPILHLL
jgi:hypothetical protein